MDRVEEHSGAATAPEHPRLASRMDRTRAGRDRTLWIAVIALLVACVALGASVAVVLNRPDLVARVMGNEAPHVRDARRRVEATPLDAAAHAALAYALQEQGRLEAAVAIYGDALAIDPEHIGSLYNRARCLLTLGRTQAGVRDLQAVLAISDVHALAAHDLAEQYVKAGRYADAVATLAPAARANPDMADLQTLMGLAYERSGDEANAIIAYKNALERDPGSEQAAQGMERLGGESR